MKSVKVSHLNGVYYRLFDIYGEIEMSKDLLHIKQLFDNFRNDEYIQELYNGEDDGLTILQEIYEDGRLITSEEINKECDY